MIFVIKSHHIPAKEHALRANPYRLYMTRQPLDNFPEKAHGMIGAVQRGEVEVQVEGNCLPFPEIASERHEKVKVERCDLSRDGNPQRAEKTAHG